MKIKIKKLHSETILPKKGTPGAAARDVFARLDSTVFVHPGETIFVPLGFSLELPHDHAAFLLPRSGIGSKQGVVLVNLVGLCDEDYRGEYTAPVWLRKDGPAFEINPGDRIAQMVVMPVLNYEFDEVDELSDTERGDGGFGSTGK